ncbi:MAG: hypothetical protein WAT51_01190 [Holophaga sp.]
MNQNWRPFFLVFLLSISVLSGQESALDLLKDPEPGTDLVLKLGGEADSNDGQLGEGKLQWRPTLKSMFSVGFTYSTLATTNTLQTSTRIASVAGEYSFGTFGVGGGYDHVSESDLLASNTFSLKPFYESGAWRVEINGSRRLTDFETFGFRDVPIIGPNGNELRVSGSATLNLASTCLGAAIDYAGDTWHAFAAYDSFSYSEFEGQTSLTAIRGANGMVSAQIFNALATRMVSRLQRFAGSRATVKAGLLDYATAIGLDVTLQPFRFGIEAGRNKDHLTENISDSLSGFLSLDTSRRTTLELRGGATQSDKLGTIRFIGLSLVWRSIPKGLFN